MRAIETFKLNIAAFEAGIVNAEWPARMQRLVSGTLVCQGPQGSEVWLDGALLVTLDVDVVTEDC